MKICFRRLASFFLSFVILVTLVGRFTFPVYAASAIASPDVVIGKGFVVALASDGAIWAWGNNSAGQMGNGASSNTNQTTAAKVDTAVKFTKIAAGESHVLALSTDGKVYSWGENGVGQLGLGSDTSNKATPTLVSALENEVIKDIAAGGNNSFAVTADGKLYAWGYNNNGMLANSDRTMVATTPVQITIPEGYTIRSLIAGQNAAAIISGDDSALFWGNNEDFQCGNSEIGNFIDTPTAKSTAVNVKMLAFGNTHASLLFHDGSISSFGTNTNGQYGNDETDSTKSIRLKPASLTSTVSAIAAGSSHMVALTTTGVVYTWGTDITATSAGEKILTPEKVDFSAFGVMPEITVVAAGYNNTALIDADGIVYMMGDNNNGQIGDSAVGNVPSELTMVRDASGSGYLCLGLPMKDIIQNVTVSAIATVPSPTYQIVIPATIDLGTLEQKKVSDPESERITSAGFSVEAKSVKYLFGEKLIEVTVEQNGTGEDFVLTGDIGDQDTLPISIHNKSDFSTSLVSGDIFATFIEDGKVDGWVRLDQSNINRAGTYKGTVVFRVSLEEIVSEN